MLRPEPRINRVYLHRAPIDMRKQRNGLAALVQEVLKQNPFSGALFLFTSMRRDRIKALYWDRNGFIVWYKVIEGGEKFSWPRHLDAESITLTAEQLEWLLDGYDIWKMKPHQSLQLSHVN